MYRFAFDKINGWDERFKRMQDWEFCIRFFRYFKMAIACPDSYLVRKFKTPNYTSANPEKEAFNMQFFIKEMMPDILKMKRYKEVLGFRYMLLANRLIMFRRYREGLKYMQISRSYDSSYCNYSNLLKSFIKSLLHLYDL
jgi:hypothetical protein